MLQTSNGGTFVDFTVFNPSRDASRGSSSGDLQPVKAPCLVTAQLVDLFAEITGWKIEFEESATSLQRRKMSESKHEPAEGTFAIVDMSADWPAQKPTGHRGKCDELVVLIDQLVGELQNTRVELSKARSALAALDPVTELVDDEILVDSFVPKYNHGRRWDDPTYQSGSFVPFHDTDAESDFQLHNDVVESSVELGSSIGLVRPPFDGWELGGETGITNNVYVDWMVDSEEQISISAGRIESDFGVGDTVATIKIDPLTNEYRASGAEDLQVFFLWDSKSTSLSAIRASERWQLLESGQAIVGTTSPLIGQVDCWEHLFGDLTVSTDELSFENMPAEIPARRLAKLLSRDLGPSEHLLVLKRD